MAMNDPIADFLTRIRNALKAQHRFVDVEWSKMRQSIAEILKGQGFIDSYLVTQESPSRGKMRLFLKYAVGRNPVIRGLKRISTPGLRRYVRHDQIPVFFGGLGVPILSTSQGVMPGNEAKKRQVGGELLCLIW
jgi:small subunit ribosomal protein S8